MPRLFIAIDLPDYIKDQLSELQRNNIPGTRRIEREQMHLTLHFIGEVDNTVQTILMQTLPQVHSIPFELSLSGVGQFPAKGKPRVLWAGVKQSENLTALHHQIGQLLSQNGIKVEERPYHPHITLARLKITPPRHAIKAFMEKHAHFRTLPFDIQTFTLFSSKPAPQKSTYTPELIISLV